METKTLILNTVLHTFNEKGIRFSMDDLSRKAHISKKTIYTLFSNKETLFLETVAYCFNRIKKHKEMIIADNSLPIQDKIRYYVVSLPAEYQEIDWRKLYIVKAKFPVIYNAIRKHLNKLWPALKDLIKQGIDSGCFKSISPTVAQLIIQASLEDFLTSQSLLNEDISLQEALTQLMNILSDGIYIPA